MYDKGNIYLHIQHNPDIHLFGFSHIKDISQSELSVSVAAVKGVIVTEAFKINTQSRYHPHSQQKGGYFIWI